DNLATLNGINQADVSVQATVNSLANSQVIGLAARYSGPALNNQYEGLIYNSSGTVRAAIYRNQGGTWTLISADVAVGPVGSVVGGTLRFETQGTALKLFLGNTLLAFAQDSTFSTGGVGMRLVGTAAVDN